MRQGRKLAGVAAQSIKTLLAPVEDLPNPIMFAGRFRNTLDGSQPSQALTTRPFAASADLMLDHARLFA